MFQIVPAGSSNSTCASLYSVKNMKPNRLAAALMVILLVTPSLTIALGMTALTVQTNKAEYEPGDEVKIRGTAEAGLNVTIDLIHDSTVLFHFNITAKGDGNYSDEITLPDDKYGTFTVNATQGGVTVQTTFTVVDKSDRDLAHELLREAKKLREHVEDIFEELREHEMEIPPGAEGNLTLGLEALALALADFEDGNYSDAAEEARLALEYFGDAFKLVQDAVAEITRKSKVRGAGEDEDEDDVEKAHGLYVAIERALIYLERVNDTAERLLDEGYVIDPEVLDEIKANLKLANGTLRALNETLGTIDPNDAAKTLAEMQGLLGRTMGLVHSSAMKDCRQKMAERFMEQVQNQIQGIEEKILRLRERLEAQKVVSVGNSLGAISKKVERLRERIGTEDLDELIDELQGEIDDIVENLEKVNGDGISLNLWAMNSIEARIRVLKSTAERLKRKGYDTTEVEGQLENAEGILEDMMTQLTAGNTWGAKGLIRDAEEYFKNISKNLHTSRLEELKRWIQEKKENNSNGRGGN